MEITSQIFIKQTHQLFSNKFINKFQKVKLTFTTNNELCYAKGDTEYLKSMQI